MLEINQGDTLNGLEDPKYCKQRKTNDHDQALQIFCTTNKTFEIFP